MTYSETRIVTAADEKFSRTLRQYLQCVERQKLASLYTWIVIDLGLKSATRNKFEKEFPWCLFRDFDFSKYPAHVKLRLTNFAWKPCVIAEEAQNFSGLLFWFDCATIFKRNLEWASDIVKKNGIWYLRSQTSISDHTDPRTLSSLKSPIELHHLAEIPAGAIGFMTNTPAISTLIMRWCKLALDEGVIDPQPKASSIHKHDQSILSALIFEAVARGEIPLLTQEIDISSARSVSTLSTRNKVANWVPQWADALVRLYYWTYKTSDRYWLAISRAASVAYGGLRRHLNEHFEITIFDRSTTKSRILPSPRYGYFADPIVWKKDSETYVFAEEYECSKDRGRLVVMKLDDELQVQSCAPLAFVDAVSEINCHASFPFLFEHDGEIYMVPETSARRTVDLFICVKWPTDWKIARRLLMDVDAADSMLIQNRNIWWLFTSAKNQHHNRHLAIFSTADLFHGTFEPHPANENQYFSKDRFGTGRNAGLFLRQTNGSLLRFKQNSKNFYGEGSLFSLVEQLDAENFSEQDCETPQELNLPASMSNCHHLSMRDNIFAWDRRTRTSFWQLVWPKF